MYHFVWLTYLITIKVSILSYWLDQSRKCIILMYWITSPITIEVDLSFILFWITFTVTIKVGDVSFGLTELSPLSHSKKQINQFFVTPNYYRENVSFCLTDLPSPFPIKVFSLTELFPLKQSMKCIILMCWITSPITKVDLSFYLIELPPLGHIRVWINHFVLMNCLHCHSQSRICINLSYWISSNDTLKSVWLNYLPCHNQY